MTVDTAPRTTPVENGRPGPAPDEEGRCADERVSFAELVFVHFLRQNELYKAARRGAPTDELSLRGPAEREYDRRLDAFTRRHGEIVNAHWCTYEISAVALTERPARSWRRLWRTEPIIRLHSATEWATREAPRIANQLYKCETLAIRVSEVLRGTSERIAMQRLLANASHTLAFVDREGGAPKGEPLERFIGQSDKELADIQAYYQRAGEKAGRIVYFAGMLWGMLWVAVLLGLLALVLWGFTGSFDRSSEATQALFASCGMGALGAFVSVMSRMASRDRRFNVDYEVGRKSIRRLGSFRPFIGAAFAFVIFLALRSDLLDIAGVQQDNRTIAFFATIGFFSGFSERWAKVILDGALGGADPNERSADDRRPVDEPAPKEAPAET